MEMECLVYTSPCAFEAVRERERKCERERERVSEKKEPWGPEEGPLGKPKPHSWSGLTSALLDMLCVLTLKT